jgi:hypothetical protein
MAEQMTGKKRPAENCNDSMDNECNVETLNRGQDRQKSAELVLSETIGEYCVGDIGKIIQKKVGEHSKISNMINELKGKALPNFNAMKHVIVALIRAYNTETSKKEFNLIIKSIKNLYDECDDLDMHFIYSELVFYIFPGNFYCSVYNIFGDDITKYHYIYNDLKKTGKYMQFVEIVNRTFNEQKDRTNIDYIALYFDLFDFNSSAKYDLEKIIADKLSLISPEEMEKRSDEIISDIVKTIEDIKQSRKDCGFSASLFVDEYKKHGQSKNIPWHFMKKLFTVFMRKYCSGVDNQEMAYYFMHCIMKWKNFDGDIHHFLELLTQSSSFGDDGKYKKLYENLKTNYGYCPFAALVNEKFKKYKIDEDEEHTIIKLYKSFMDSAILIGQ